MTAPTSAVRVVVVGAGMVGTRFADELHARAGQAVDLTVLGSEGHEPYTRVLLSDVVAGRTELGALTMPSPVGARLLRDTTVAGIDRVRRAVTCDDGSAHGYDLLVLATGARARVPRVAGLPAVSSALPRGVHVLRTLDDAREILAAAANGPEAVVLGGGVLGVEVACGLARRGLVVTLLHHGPHPMDGSLGPGAGAAVAATLGRLGVRVRTRVRAVSVRHDGQGVAAVVVRDTGAGAVDRPDRDGPGAGAPGEEDVRCRLLVVTAGTEPETTLAAAAGLAVGRGVRVDPDGATSDPAVFAIGDCAEPPEGSSGLVAQGWDQARRLAARIAALVREEVPTTARPAAVDAARDSAEHDVERHDIVRVKADGLVVSVMGLRADRAPSGARSVLMSDPSAARHVEVLVHDGVLVGAVCVGDAGVAADLTAAYTRRTPAPRDPAQLLLRPVRGAEPAAAASPTLMPDRATVCRCNGVTKGDVVARWRSGARSVAEVVRATRATTGCGGCADAVCGLVEWLERVDPEPVAPGEVEQAAVDARA